MATLDENKTEKKYHENGRKITKYVKLNAYIRAS